MHDVSPSLATPVEVEVHGNTWRMSPLCYADIGEFEAWMREQYLRVSMGLLKAIKDGPDFAGLMTADDISRETTRIARVSRMLSLLPPSGDIGDTPTNEARAQSVMMQISLEGSTRLLWLSLRREHPTVTVKAVGEWTRDQRTLDRMRAAFDRLNNPPDDQPGKVPAAEASPSPASQ